MLYLFYGTDTHAARTAAAQLREKLAQKRPDAQHFTLAADSFSDGAVDELLHSQGLFEAKYVVTLDQVSDAEGAADAIAARLEALQASPHVFICVEGSLHAARAKKWAAVAQQAREYTASVDAAAEKAAQQKRFALADALGNRDRRALWIGLQEAFADGAAPEELHGLLFWQAKNMRIARGVDSPAAAGLKPFVYRKAKTFAGNYDDDELAALLTDLVTCYHDAHRGMHELDVALERFALTV